jgi:flagellar basal-body rod protein FlgB
MIIKDLMTADALPALTAQMQFAARRQPLIAHNIANISTPDFRPVDVKPQQFQEALSEAVDRRRERFGGVRGELEIRESRELRVDSRGRLDLRPTASGDNVLFHDRNDRDVERLLQAQTENLAAFRLASQLFRSRMDLLNTAITERV